MANQHKKRYVAKHIQWVITQSSAHTSFTPASGICHRLKPETSCSQYDITRQTLRS